MVQQVKELASRPGGIGSISEEAHIMERENQLLLTVILLPHVWVFTHIHSYIPTFAHTHIHTHK